MKPAARFPSLLAVLVVVFGALIARTECDAPPQMSSIGPGESIKHHHHHHNHVLDEGGKTMHRLFDGAGEAGAKSDYNKHGWSKHLFSMSNAVGDAMSGGKGGKAAKSGYNKNGWSKHLLSMSNAVGDFMSGGKSKLSGKQQKKLKKKLKKLMAKLEKKASATGKSAKKMKKGLQKQISKLQKQLGMSPDQMKESSNLLDRASGENAGIREMFEGYKTPEGGETPEVYFEQLKKKTMEGHDLVEASEKKNGKLDPADMQKATTILKELKDLYIAFVGHAKTLKKDKAVQKEKEIKHYREKRSKAVIEQLKKLFAGDPDDYFKKMKADTMKGYNIFEDSEKRTLSRSELDRAASVLAELKDLDGQYDAIESKLKKRGSEVKLREINNYRTKRLQTVIAQLEGLLSKAGPEVKHEGRDSKGKRMHPHMLRGGCHGRKCRNGRRERGEQNDAAPKIEEANEKEESGGGGLFLGKRGGGSYSNHGAGGDGGSEGGGLFLGKRGGGGYSMSGSGGEKKPAHWGMKEYINTTAGSGSLSDKLKAQNKSPLLG